ncbi:MAG: hypothetical protein ACI9SP_003215 [Arenicella sp.]|jgi:uncharacterized protein YyaL (SSP411 family)
MLMQVSNAQATLLGQKQHPKLVKFMILSDVKKTIQQSLAKKRIPVLVLGLGFTLSLFVSVWSSENESLESVYNSKKGSYPLTTRHLDERQEPLFVNRLIQQDSLYLLQHAHNPVQWWGWGDDAFAKAKELNKPVFLSIGYSTCHWCHVMAKESFDDIEIANFINEHFIPIKVDREEYPDVDELYLTSVQMLSGKVGWPLTAVLTPDGQAFFGGTYFQPVALLSLLNKVSDTWVQRQDAVLEQANRLSDALSAINKSSDNTKTINASVIAEAASRIQAELSRSVNNGLKQSKPGFPREPEMLFLLNHARRNLSEPTINIVTQRLLKLAAGGIHDQVGGGFHRYTVDPNWVIPHFEKMLYNQAQMGRAYFLGYQLSGNPALRTVGDKTFEFLLNDMQAPDGGFYSAMDAQSEDANGITGEGEFYTWTYQQLSSQLNQDQLSVANTFLGTSPKGNFNGSNVLQNSHFDPTSLDRTSLEHGLEVGNKIDSVISKLALDREQRKSPQLDTKIITSWNAMAISALVTGYSATDNQAYLRAAKKAANRLWKQSYDQQGGLARTISNNKQRLAGTLEDYAYFANALIDIYDIEGDELWLERSDQIVKQMITRFHDIETGGFLISNATNNKVPMMKLVTARDDAIYSGNSVAAQVLARMAQRTGSLEFKQSASSTISAFSQQLFANPEALSGMLLAAEILNQGDIGSRQYAAKGKVIVTANINSDNTFSLNIDIAKGWHINASQVLNKYLIPTALTPASLGSSDKCLVFEKVSYPKGELVSLGFQEDKLLVYENSVTLSADLSQSTPKSTESRCQTLAAELSIQACTDEVCQAPEKIQIRAHFKP